MSRRVGTTTSPARGFGTHHAVRLGGGGVRLTIAAGFEENLQTLALCDFCNDRKRLAQFIYLTGLLFNLWGCGLSGNYEIEPHSLAFRTP